MRKVPEGNHGSRESIETQTIMDIHLISRRLTPQSVDNASQEECAIMSICMPRSLAGQ